jgi:tetratricopeptide (TPR) repeat protein
MLELNSQLGLPQPTIIDKPFTSIRALLDNIVDIDDKEHFKGVKERLKIAKAQVDEAIQQFEQGKIETADKIQANAENDLLKKQIIDLMIKGEYQQDKIDRIAVKSKALNDTVINSLLADLYNNWGNSLGNLAQTKSGDEAEALYRQAFDKFPKAVEIKPDDHQAFNNWGTYLGNLAQTKSGDEAEALYRQALEKHQKAIDLGAGCYNLACVYALKQDKENALMYLDRSLESKQIATEFVINDPDWAGYLNDEDFKAITNRHMKH